MQSVLSRIWTRVVVSISYNDNHYTTGTSIIIILMGCIYFESFEWFCLQISHDRKYFFPLLSKALWSRINSFFYSIFEYETNENTTLLLVKLLAVTWVPCIPRHPAYILLPHQQILGTTETDLTNENHDPI